MSRKLTKTSNLIFNNETDLFKSGASSAYVFTEYKVTEATNQSELETTDSSWKKHDEIVQEKIAIIQDLKSQIAQLEVENWDLNTEVIQILNTKLLSDFSKPTPCQVSITLHPQCKIKRAAKDMRLYSKDNYIMKIDLR